MLKKPIIQPAMLPAIPATRQAKRVAPRMNRDDRAGPNWFMGRPTRGAGRELALDWPRQHLLQPRLHARPLRIDHAEPDAMPDPAGGRDDVVAERPLLLAADPQHRVTRLLVERVGLQLHPHAAERLEGVPQHQILRLSIDWRPLPRFGHPRPADL